MRLPLVLTGLLLATSACASPPMRGVPYQAPLPFQTFTVTGNADTVSASVYIAASSNQLTLSTGNWPSWAPGATVCVPGAGQSYTTNAAGTTWVAGTSYVIGDLVNWNGLMLTPFRNNSDTYFQLADWFSVLGGVTATDLETTIVSVAGSTATLATNASTTVTSGSPSTCWYGLDDTSAFNSAVQAANAAWVSGPSNEVDVANVGTYQVGNVPILSHVHLSIANSTTIRPTMPIGSHAMFLLRNADGSLSSGCSVTGNWTADYTGVQAQNYSAGTWSPRTIGAVYVDAAADWAVRGVTGNNLTGGNVVQITPTAANIDPIRGAVTNITSTQSSGFGQSGYGTVQDDGSTATVFDSIVNHGIGRALNLETDDSGNGTRTLAGVDASNIQEVGGSAPIYQEALGIYAHANNIYDVSVYGVSGTAGGCGAVIGYTAGTVGSVANFTINGLRVVGGGYAVSIGNNDVVTAGSISTGTFDGCTTINQSNGKPYAAALFTAGLTYSNCTASNGGNSGFQSVFFDGSQGSQATGTVTLTNCTSTNNGGGAGVTTSYGFENNYVQHLVANGSTAAGAGSQTFGLYAGARTDATLNSCNITQTTGPGTIIVH